MKITLTEAANMNMGGYSWIRKGATNQEDVTGLTLETSYHNESGVMVEFTLEGFPYALGNGAVLVSRKTLEDAGFSGFSGISAYAFKPSEFTIVEDTV